MFSMGGEVLAVGVDQVGMAPNHQQVLGVLFLGLGGEVETAGEEGLAVEKHDLVVSDGVMRVNERCQALFKEVGELGVGLLLVAVVENEVDVDAAQFGLDESLGNGPGGERVGQDQDLTASPLDLADDGVGAATFGG